MTQKKREPLMVVHMDVRKLKPEPETNLPSVSKARLEKLIAEAVVDAYTEQEQAVGFLTMIQDHLVLPFSVNILGVEAVVEKVDMTRDGRIVAGHVHFLHHSLNAEDIHGEGQNEVILNHREEADGLLL